MLPIRIMTRDFLPVAEVKQYESLQLTRSWHGIGAIELRVNRYTQNADMLQRGVIISPHNRLDKAHEIRHKEIELDHQGKITENWIIRALPLKAWFGQRITYPPAHTANDNKQDDAETVMQHYVINNIINPVDINRRLADVVLAENLHRGETVSWQSRYKNLAEEQAEISMLSGLGWNIEPDFQLKKYVFKVLEGADLSANQSGRPQAIFSPEFKTLKSMGYVESDMNYQNTAIVAGQGEGVERRIVEVGAFTGHDRYEMFVDARDVNEMTEYEDGRDPLPRPDSEIISDLQNRGNQKLAEHQQEIYLEGQVLEQSRLIYQRDYDLGDIVTLQNRGWGVTMDARITEVKEIYERDKGMQLEVVFGSNRPTLISKIKQELAGMRNEIVR